MGAPSLALVDEGEGRDREIAGDRYLELSSLLLVDCAAEGERFRLSCRSHVLDQGHSPRSVGCQFATSSVFQSEAPWILSVRLRRGGSFQAQAG